MAEHKKQVIFTSLKGSSSVRSIIEPTTIVKSTNYSYVQNLLMKQSPYKERD